MSMIKDECMELRGCVGECECDGGGLGECDGGGQVRCWDFCLFVVLRHSNRFFSYIMALI